MEDEIKLDNWLKGIEASMRVLTVLQTEVSQELERNKKKLNNNLN